VPDRGFELLPICAQRAHLMIKPIPAVAPDPIGYVDADAAGNTATSTRTAFIDVISIPSTVRDDGATVAMTTQ